MIRTAYMIEVFNTNDNMLTYRNFARNKKVAEFFARRFRRNPYNEVTVRKLSEIEKNFISLEGILG